MKPRFYFFRGRYALAHYLKSLELPADSEVAIQAFTCVAVLEGIQVAGLKPVFVDVSPNDVVLDFDSFKRQVTKKTRVLVVQHTFGRLADMERIVDYCRNNGIRIIEDCCHTWSSITGGTKAGDFGDASFYSFEWGKPIVGGLGGLLKVNEPVSAKFFENYYLRNIKKVPLLRRLQLELQYVIFKLFYGSTSFWFLRRVYRQLSRLKLVTPSYNKEVLKLAEANWVMSPGSQRRVANIEELILKYESHAKEIEDIYRAELQEHNAELSLPEARPGDIPHRFPLFVRNKAELLGLAEKRNIEMAGWYNTAVHPLDGTDLEAVGFNKSTCPNAQRAAASIVSLPTGFHVQPEKAKQIAEFVARHAK